ncbi:MAG: MBL fold metallo-hydrolase [Bdellovibrionota bacterium]
MKVHHLNCGTLCPLGSGLIYKGKTGGKLICHVLLIETPSSGLVLVDTGFGLDDIKNPWSRLGPGHFFVGPRLLAEESAFQQVKKLGLEPRDVRHIILTHLDSDHAGGIADFPWAKIHVHSAEKEAALHPALLDFKARARYRQAQWAHGPNWQAYHSPGDTQPTRERWFGFQAVRELRDLPPEILMIPLHGHSTGHCAVAVKTPDQGWLLHCGDAYFFRGEVHGRRRRCPPFLEFFQTQFAVDNTLRLSNQLRLRELARDHRVAKDVRVFCSHDVSEM